MIQNFTCHNFRNINADRLELGHINLLIGPNNSGKTNLIHAIMFCTNMLRQSTQTGHSAFVSEISEEGWSHIHNQMTDPGSPVELQWDLDLDRNPGSYKLSFVVGQNTPDVHIVHESLDDFFVFHDPTMGRGWFSSSGAGLQAQAGTQESILMQFKDILLNDKRLYASDDIRVKTAGIIEQLRRNFLQFHAYSGGGINSGAVRSRQDIRMVDPVLKPDGSNLVSVLNLYQAADLSWKKEFLEHMTDLMHDVSQIDIVSEYDRLVMKMVYDKGQYDLSDVSEGTIKGLIYNYLINMPHKNPISFLAMDDPETNLHPAWQKAVSQWILTSPAVDQFLISTHSPDFLDQFTEGFRQGSVKVLVMGNYGEGSIRQVRYEDIKDDLGDWTIGDLYRTNDPALGGWPW